MDCKDLIDLEKDHLERIEELFEKKKNELIEAWNKDGVNAYIGFTKKYLNKVVEDYDAGKIDNEDAENIGNDIKEAAKKCVEIRKEKIKNNEYFWTEETYGPLTEVLIKYDIVPPRGSVDMCDDSFLYFSKHESDKITNARREYEDVLERKKEIEEYISGIELKTNRKTDEERIKRKLDEVLNF
ncbi:MAG: hypothetical protein J7L08_00955 [Candidatus Aenigmarchaeota archaeon]|nr:hypothetical protein [Candidatus Aenigmarchaeota archaeon]